MGGPNGATMPHTVLVSGADGALEQALASRLGRARRPRRRNQPAAGGAAPSSGAARAAACARQGGTPRRAHTALGLWV